MGIDAEIRVRIPEPMDDQAIMRLSVDAKEAFSGLLWVDRERRQAGIERYELREWDTLPPGNWLKVNTMARYYGEAYERGPIVDFIALAEWFEFRIPGCEVYYGGDHNDSYEAFTAERRREYFEHFARVGGRPYRDRGLDPGPSPECDWCETPMRPTIYHAMEATTFKCVHCGHEVKLQRQSAV